MLRVQYYKEALAKGQKEGLSPTRPEHQDRPLTCKRHRCAFGAMLVSAQPAQMALPTRLYLVECLNVAGRVRITCICFIV